MQNKNHSSLFSRAIGLLATLACALIIIAPFFPILVVVSLPLIGVIVGSHAAWIYLFLIPFFSVVTFSWTSVLVLFFIALLCFRLGKKKRGSFLLSASVLISLSLLLHSGPLHRFINRDHYAKIEARYQELLAKLTAPVKVIALKGWNTLLFENGLSVRISVKNATPFRQLQMKHYLKTEIVGQNVSVSLPSLEAYSKRNRPRLVHPGEEENEVCETCIDRAEVRYRGELIASRFDQEPATRGSEDRELKKLQCWDIRDTSNEIYFKNENDLIHLSFSGQNVTLRFPLAENRSVSGVLSETCELTITPPQMEETTFTLTPNNTLHRFRKDADPAMTRYGQVLFNPNIEKEMLDAQVERQKEQKRKDYAISQHANYYSIQLRVTHRDFSKHGVASFVSDPTILRGTQGLGGTYIGPVNLTVAYKETSECLDLLKTKNAVRLIGPISSVRTERVKGHPRVYRFEIRDSSHLECEEI